MSAYARRRDRAVEKLGVKEFEAAWARGEAMSEEEAVAHALSDPKPQEAGSNRTAEKEASPAGPASLTHREREVANLVAAGLTNRRISERLHISPRTADTHVARILKKLGANSREEVAARLEE